MPRIIQNSGGRFEPIWSFHSRFECSLMKVKTVLAAMWRVRLHMRLQVILNPIVRSKMVYEQAISRLFLYIFILSILFPRPDCTKIKIS